MDFHRINHKGESHGPRHRHGFHGATLPVSLAVLLAIPFPSIATSNEWNTSLHTDPMTDRVIVTVSHPSGLNVECHERGFPTVEYGPLRAERGQRIPVRTRVDNAPSRMLAWLADQYGVALSGREAASFLVEAGDGDTLLIRNEMGLSDFRAGEIVSINLSGLRNALDDCPGGFDRLFNIASGEERTAREPSIRWESSPNQTHAGPGRDRTRFVSVWADRVRNAWERPSGTARGATADVAVALRSTGHVDHIEIVRSSGDRNFDQSVIAAIQAASPLPVPDSAEAFQRANLDKVTFRFNPDGS